MGPQEVVPGYLALVQRLGALLPGAVSTTRSPSPSPSPEPGPPVTAARIVRDAGELAAALDHAGLEADRARFLRSQLVAIETTARRLAGQAVPYVAEVAATCETVVEVGGTDAYREAHHELEVLLPGRGALARRLRAHRDLAAVEPERVAPLLAELADVLRERTRAVVPLPDGERVEFRVVRDAPWTALHTPLDRFRSRITVNAGTRLRAPQLARLVAHEAYPGHHVQRCRAEAVLVARGWDEHRVVVACTPQSLVAEGAAELGATLAPPPAAVCVRFAPALDPDLDARVEAACAPLARVRQDAALLLHDRRAPEAAVREHLRRWALVDDEGAGRIVRFLRHPVWRAYTTAYVEGVPLVRRWWEREPDAARFRRLLDEPLTPAALRAGLREVPAERVSRRPEPRQAVSRER
jgi:hypothetical protein